MRSPLDDGPWLELEEVDSTQGAAAEALLSVETVPGVVLAHNQTAGKGRFDRTWHSDPDDSLTMSLIFQSYAQHPKPYLIGMAAACAAAGALHCDVRWPNDLTINGKKVGGILTELLPDKAGNRVPVVGIGINLNQTEFPADLGGKATSLHIETVQPYDLMKMAASIIQRFALLPEPTDWTDLEPVWRLFDATPGKPYRLANGETATAIGVGPEGRLLCSVRGESSSVLAADAIFGPLPEPLSTQNRP